MDWWKMAFSPDGRLVGLGGNFWQVETGEILAGWPPSGQESASTATGLAFAPDGKVAALGLPTGQVQFWDLNSLSLVQSLSSEFPGDVISLAYIPDGSQLAGAQAYTGEIYPSPYAQAWQMPAGILQVRLTGANIVYVIYSPDGMWLASLASQYETYQRNFPYGFIQIWSPDGELITTLPEQDAVRLAISPDGQLLAMGLGNGHVQLWSPEGQLIQELDTGQFGVIAGLAFTPDGQGLVIVSATGLIELWGSGSQ